MMCMKRGQRVVYSGYNALDWIAGAGKFLLAHRIAEDFVLARLNGSLAGTNTRITEAC